MLSKKMVVQWHPRDKLIIDSNEQIEVGAIELAQKVKTYIC